jgi:hypothetical protein
MFMVNLFLVKLVFSQIALDVKFLLGLVGPNDLGAFDRRDVFAFAALPSSGQRQWLHPGHGMVRWHQSARRSFCTGELRLDLGNLGEKWEKTPFGIGSKMNSVS